ncbi:hypothetical protein ACFX13_018774 [Malus domestica]
MDLRPIEPDILLFLIEDFHYFSPEVVKSCKNAKDDSCSIITQNPILSADELGSNCFRVGLRHNYFQ